MKQNITPDQLRTLSYKSRVRLRKRWTPLANDLAWLPESNEVITVAEVKESRHFPKIEKMALPLFSIGQMISLLDFKWEDKDSIARCKVADVTNWGWTVQYRNNRCHKEELCDALWEIVKVYLEKI